MRKPPRSRAPLDRLEQHLSAAESHLAAARTIAVELQGDAAIQAEAKQEADREALAQRAMRVIETQPGLNLTQLQTVLKAQHKALKPAIDLLVRRGFVRVTTTAGKQRARLHFSRTQRGIDDN